MSISIALSLAGFAAFMLAGASVRSFYTSNTRTAYLCARYSVVLGSLALALAALLLSAVVFWPLAFTANAGVLVADHWLRGPIQAIAASSALAVVALPAAFLVLRAIRRRSESTRESGWSTTTILRGESR